MLWSLYNHIPFIWAWLLNVYHWIFFLPTICWRLLVCAAFHKKALLHIKWKSWMGATWFCDVDWMNVVVSIISQDGSHCYLMQLSVQCGNSWVGMGERLWMLYGVWWGSTKAPGLIPNRNYLCIILLYMYLINVFFLNKHAKFFKICASCACFMT